MQKSLSDYVQSADARHLIEELERMKKLRRCREGTIRKEGQERETSEKVQTVDHLGEKSCEKKSCSA